MTVAIRNRMRACYTSNPPTLWMMTDERMGAALLPSVRALPKGSGIVFRHYSLPAKERRALFNLVRRTARARRLWLLLGGSDRLARHWKADGAHHRSATKPNGWRSAPVHTVRERLAAERAGANILFVSPIFATRSHPEGKGLGRVRFGLTIRNAKKPVIALGGLNAARAKGLKSFGIWGWAAIDALSHRADLV
jgi:thiamine-phosphate pyrophosphorylase